MQLPPLQVTLPAALVAGFAVGKVIVGGSSGAPGDAIAGAPGQPDPSYVGTTADPLGLGDQAGLNFGWDPTGSAGTLNGTIPGSGAGYDGGGLPGGGLPGDPLPPGFNPSPLPPVGFGTNPPTPGPSGAPRGRTLTARGLRTLYSVSGGVAHPTTYQTGKNFTAPVGPYTTLRTANGSATFVKILAGAYTGRYVHTSDPGVSMN